MPGNSTCTLMLAASVVWLGCLFPAYAAPSNSPLAADPGIAGDYALTGVHEVVAGLRLAPDGKFQYGITYGAVDQVAHGRWSMVGRVLYLVTEPDPKPSLSFGKTESSLPDPYDRDAQRHALLVVAVRTPRLGMSWSSMQITAEFSNGQTRSGKTGDSGTLAFEERKDGPWAGAVVRRVSVAFPQEAVAPVWFPIDATKTKSLVVHFEPGNMIKPAFESMTLEVRREPSAPPDLVQTSTGPDKGWKYLWVRGPR